MNKASDRVRRIVPWVCGVLAALLWVGVVGTAAVVAHAIVAAYCAPQPECGKAGTSEIVSAIAVTAGLALLFGLAVRRLVEWALPRPRDAAPAGGPPLWAAAAALILGAAMLWIVSQFFLF